MRFSGDQASDVINSGEVGLAIFLRRRANANEDGFAGFHGGGRITSKGKAVRFDIGGQQSVEIWFINGNDAGVQRGDAFLIVVGANDFVPGFGETSSCNKSDITAANHRDSQFRKPPRSVKTKSDQSDTLEFR